LDVSERDASVEGGGDEGVPERTGADRLVDSGSAGESAYDPPGGVSVEALPVEAKEDRTLNPLADGQVDGSRRARRQRNDNDLAAFAQDRQGAVAALEPERLDIRTESFGDT
jgi:hypothetical protein